jgi:hypothetical protein
LAERNGQKYAPKLGDVSLPSNITEKAVAALNTSTHGNACTLFSPLGIGETIIEWQAEEFQK